MVQLSPDTRKDDWDGCSGYHYSDSTIMGFSHTHLSGTGVGDYGDIRFMPTVGKVILNPTKDENNESGYQSKFSHKTETASPGYYQVLLNDYNINVELTTTQRAGFHKYTFPKTENANIIIDLFEGVTSDQILDLWIRFVSDTEIEGLRRTKGWADNQWVFFNAEFSKPFAGYGISVDNKIDEGLQYAQGKNIKAWVNFQTEEELNIIINHCKNKGVNVAINNGWAKGGEGSLELAELVISEAVKSNDAFRFLYELESPIREKIKIIAQKMYGASDVEYSNSANKIIQRIKKLGFSNLAICIAKTQNSLSDNSSLIGRPTDFTVSIRDIELATGAGFIIPIAGEIMRMPGLPATPAAENIDIDLKGNITGLF
jgi:hypothetical protein